MGKDLFSRKLKIGMTKESNFLARQRPLVGVGQNMSLNLESISIES